MLFRSDKYMRYADRVMAGMATNSNGVLGILEVKASLLGAQHRYNEQLALIKESRIPSPIQISIIASVLRPNVPNTPILSVDQPQN